MEVSLDNIGVVHFYSSNKAKRVIIYVKKNNKIKVAVPLGVSFNKAKEFVLSKSIWIKRSQKKISKKIVFNNSDIDKKLAKIILIKRLNKISLNTGLSYNKVSIRHQKTRWGSCSSNNNINLINLPLKLIDYVILHELVHTVEKNHSTNFWNLLNTYLPNAKNLNRELDKYAL